MNNTVKPFFLNLLKLIKHQINLFFSFLFYYYFSLICQQIIKINKHVKLIKPTGRVNFIFIYKNKTYPYITIIINCLLFFIFLNCLTAINIVHAMERPYDGVEFSALQQIFDTNQATWDTRFKSLFILLEKQKYQELLTQINLYIDLLNVSPNFGHVDINQLFLINEKNIGLLLGKFIKNNEEILRQIENVEINSLMEKLDVKKSLFDDQIIQERFNPKVIREIIKPQPYWPGIINNVDSFRNEDGTNVSEGSSRGSFYESITSDSSTVNSPSVSNDINSNTSSRTSSPDNIIFEENSDVFRTRSRSFNSDSSTESNAIIVPKRRRLE